mgnify:CR=1 FL=1
MRLLEPVGALVEDQLCVVACEKHEQVNALRISHMGTSWYKLLQVQINEWRLLIRADNLQISIELVQVRNRLSFAIDFDNQIFAISGHKVSKVVLDFFNRDLGL